MLGNCRAVGFGCLVMACALVCGKSECEESFVGNGWAGVYAAYRRATAVRDPSKLCLFGQHEPPTISSKISSPLPANSDEYNLPPNSAKTEFVGRGGAINVFIF